MTAGEDERLIAQLRAAGCVFAEEEAAVLRRWAADPRQLAAWAVRRAAGEPLEHVVGRVEFAGLDLVVGPGAFVPRQRSALLAATAVDLLAARRSPVFVEAFCGVAPIAAYVADRCRGAYVVATDADPVALAFAAENLSADAVYRGAGLSGLPEPLRGRVDVIAAVPPYVPESAVELLPHEAVDHEPRAALVGGGDDGLLRAAELLQQARSWLLDGGAVVIEMNVAQTSAASEIARAGGLSPSVIEGGDGQTAVLIGLR
ncbi:N5-glutamine methyltransferase family protein [Gordonia neofelifaecis]|uniref:Modification methylase, HemK family protein n=1 Tax=Gordonia neofelifaecis NRRL B-59395 TaxID=644548 RepID=F1YH81_9ACTN|nr:methyltransferase [Gordonia neofelifaecis]EGD55996.1 modification methylase, HemK family protein [Gordonia neofelifaecis NRRL B-59395]